jgi:hypothetical protein
MNAAVRKTVASANVNRYAGQRIFVVRREDSVYLVPFPPSPPK